MCTIIVLLMVTLYRISYITSSNFVNVLFKVPDETGVRGR